MSKSTVDRLLKEKEESLNEEKFTAEQIEQLKDCINRIFSSPDGAFFWKFLKKGMRVDVIDRKFEPFALAGDKALRNLYLSIRQFMDVEVREKLER
jgi:hypothetical protein